MLASLEITIKPKKSSTYLRFVTVLYGFSFFLLAYSSLYFFVKFLITLLLLLQFARDFYYQNPCSSLKEIRCCKKKWILVINNGTMQPYDEASILVHNVLFQLIAFSACNKKKCIVLFNDQLSSRQWRALHLIAG